EGDRKLGGHKPTHRIAHQGCRAHPERVQQPVEDARIRRDCDALVRHRRVTEPWKVYRDNAMVFREHGQLLQPVRPTARQAVDENDRGPLSHIDRVDRRALHGHPALVLAPVHVQPVRASLRSVGWAQLVVEDGAYAAHRPSNLLDPCASRSMSTRPCTTTGTCSRRYPAVVSAWNCPTRSRSRGVSRGCAPINCSCALRRATAPRRSSPGTPTLTLSRRFANGASRDISST